MSSRRIRNSRRNKHVVNYWWRGDIEDEKHWCFPTQEAAWAHVVGEVRRRIKWFETEETANGHGRTILDWDKFKKDLLEGGRGCVEYCQCSAWWDNWEYFKKD